MLARRLRARYGRLVVPFIGVLLIALAVPAVAQDLDSVVEKREDLESQVADATARYEEVWARVNQAEVELATLEDRVAELEAEAAQVNQQLEARARSVFMYGSDTVLSSFVTADGPQSALERAGLMSAITSRDQGRLEGAVNLRTQLSQARALLEDTAQELEADRAQLQEIKAELETELEQTRILENDIREREARKRRIQRGVQNGVYSCIFDPASTHFRDTWGAPRSGGRRHKGVDTFSYYGAPVYAFNGGRIHRMRYGGGLGGIALYLWGNDGNLYYYAHLSGFAPGISVGTYVEAGQLVAYNGDTGNARGGAPHVHFEVHPGGGGAVNPYPWMAAACF